MELRTVTSASLIVLFTRQFWVAASTFKRSRDRKPVAPRLVIPLSMALLVRFSRAASPSAASFAAGSVVAASSLALLEWSRRSIRGRYFSCLFSTDVPRFLWTSGPYAYVRNPFYASYLLAYAAAAIMLPGVNMVLLFVGMFAYYSAAAVLEERKFAGSPLAAEYDAYKRRTGRFTPMLRAGAATGKGDGPECA